LTLFGGACQHRQRRMTVAVVRSDGVAHAGFQCAQLLTVDSAAAPPGIGSPRTRFGIAYRRVSITTAPSPTHFSITGSSTTQKKASGLNRVCPHACPGPRPAESSVRQNVSRNHTIADLSRSRSPPHTRPLRWRIAMMLRGRTYRQSSSPRARPCSRIRPGTSNGLADKRAARSKRAQHPISPFRPELHRRKLCIQ